MRPKELSSELKPVFWINLKIALRNLRKYKLYAAINVLGLAIAMAIYVYTGIGVRGMTNYDNFFKNSDRIYSLAIKVGPKMQTPSENLNKAPSAYFPFIAAEIGDIEATARNIPSDYLVRANEYIKEERIDFADPELLEIFDFEYLYGNNRALQDPTALVITESTAIRLFGNTDILGSTIAIDNRIDRQIAAVIKDIPGNSYFKSTQIFASISTLVALDGIRPEGRWAGRVIEMIFVLLPAHLDKQWLNTQLEGIYERHTPEYWRDYMSGLFAIHVSEVELWDMYGVPAIYIFFIPSILILGIACINYTNLATAQSLRRSREIGMRKTMGATRTQMLGQFLTESILISALAMLLATAAIEVLASLYTDFFDEDVIGFNYLGFLPWLMVSALIIGLAAGSYPAWMITRVSPINALRDIAHKGKTGARMRSFMIGAQFTVSIFMLAVVLVVYAQNKQIEETSYSFPRSEIYTLTELRVANELVNLDLLQHEIEAISTVNSVSFSTSIPFISNSLTRTMSLEPGDEATEFKIVQIDVTPEFFTTYDIPFLAGRNLNKNIANDYERGVSVPRNVVINEPALALLGLTSAEEGINKRLFSGNPDTALFDFIVAGVVSVPGFQILDFSYTAPVFFVLASEPQFASVRFTPGTEAKTLEDLESVWSRIAPEQSIQGQFLDERFEQTYSEFVVMNKVIAMLTLLAISLATVGLFGLSAFMSGQRTREISVRKVYGASSAQIVSLLTWQMAKPVICALAIALPSGFIVASFYLNFFPIRTPYAIPIILLSGLIVVLLGWATVAGQTYRVARTNPADALRYE